MKVSKICREPEGLRSTYPFCPFVIYLSISSRFQIRTSPSLFFWTMSYKIYKYIVGIGLETYPNGMTLMIVIFEKQFQLF